MKTFAIVLLRAYKCLFSPWLLPACRYVPTCSEYAEEAIERFGVLRGGWMAALRLLRCHPFVKGGYDPVVPRTEARETETRVQQAVREQCTPADSAAR